MHSRSCQLLFFGLVCAVMSERTVRSCLMSPAGASAGIAVLLAGLTYISFRYYKAGKQCKPAVGASLLVSLGMTAMMYSKFAKSQGVHLAVIGFVRWATLGTVHWAGPRPSRRACMLPKQPGLAAGLTQLHACRMTARGCAEAMHQHSCVQTQAARNACTMPVAMLPCLKAAAYVKDARGGMRAARAHTAARLPFWHRVC